MILFTGNGKAGSWRVRGEQLGTALGARVQPLATASDIESASLAVVVKRVHEAALKALKGRRWVYDIVDAYPQPASSGWLRAEAVGWVRTHIRAYSPTAVIWPNERMREDCDDGRPGLVLPHHHRPGIQVNPIRERVQTVGYEGSERYLAEWGDAIRVECKRRGWRFVVNPQQLAELDIVVAFRGGQWDGYVPRNWKSNVKLANAHASGTPFIGQPEAGYLENATGAEYWARRPQEVATCFDWLEAQSTREQVSDRFRANPYTLEAAAGSLAEFLDRL